MKNEGIFALDNNHLEIADVLLNAVVKKDEQTIVSLAKTKFRLQNWQKAISFFRFIKNPSVEDLLDADLAFNKLEHHQEACKFFKQAYEKHTDTHQVAKNYQAAFAYTLVNLKLYAEAEIIYNNILPLYNDPDDKHELNIILEKAALVKGELGKWREAKAILESMTGPYVFFPVLSQKLEFAKQMVELLDLLV